MAAQPRRLVLSLAEVERRVDAAMRRYAAHLPPDVLGGLLAVLFPEEYAEQEDGAGPIAALPSTAGRLEAMAARAERRAAVLRPGDSQAPDEVGWLADSAVVVDADGTRRPSGMGAGAARCRGDAPVDRAYAPLTGGRGIDLPPVTDQQWKKWQEKRERREGEAPAPAPPETDAERLGQRARHFRELRGLTLGQVAQRARVSKPHLCLIESGRRVPSVEALRRIAWALRLTPDELLGPA